MQSKFRVLAISVFLCGFLLLWMLPLYIAFVAASHPAKAMMQQTLPWGLGQDFIKNFWYVWNTPLSSFANASIATLLWNSFWLACVVAVAKIALAFSSAFALVFYEVRGLKLWWALILLTLLLPIEVRIMPTFSVVVMLQGINTWYGIAGPLMASATATLLLSEFFNAIPNDLVAAAKLDGVGAYRFMRDIVWPLSLPYLSALFVVMFIYGWNQYLWPLLAITSPQDSTILLALKSYSSVSDEATPWHLIMMLALLSLIPPCAILLLCQRWFEKGMGAQ